MDIAAARTFLEIVKTGSFAHAANNLNFTQTAIGARVKVLEEELGQQLFVRHKTGAQLTRAGEQFLRYASSFVQLWDQARRAVALPPGREMLVSVGAAPVVYNPILLRFLRWMQREHPAAELRAHIARSDELIERVIEGSLDAAIVYGDQRRPGLVSEILAEERLVQVRTVAHPDRHGPEHHIAIDWGEDFAAGFQAAFPDFPRPLVSINHGPAAVAFLLANGGTAYLRSSVARPLQESGQLELVPDAPAFSYSIFAIRSTSANEDLVSKIMTGLRAAAV